MMSDFFVTPINPDNCTAMAQVDTLLVSEGIRKDAHLDYTCGIFDDEGRLIATGSCFSNTLRCFAVSASYQGMGLLNLILTHLIEVQVRRGNTHLFLYTKGSSAAFFKSLGFYEIARVDDDLVFMENTKTGFSSYLASLEAPAQKGGKSAAIVMNANPFTLGHQYLIERAASENDILHLFMVSEDCSLVPYSVRRELILEGTSHLSNIVYHDSGSYIISNATFPSYFQKDSVSAICGHARLDLCIFCRIAEQLGITARYVGAEKKSLVTGIYNEIMRLELPLYGISCVEVPRTQYNGQDISASTARLAIRRDDFSLLRSLVPDCTYRYFTSDAAAPVIAAIKSANDIIQY